MNGSNENRINQLAGRFSNIVLLGFFALVCMLPVVTIGASCTALNKAMYELLENDDDKVLVTFFRAFKEHFLLASEVWLLHLLAIAVLVWDLVYYRTGSSTLDFVGQAASFSLLVMIALELMCVFVLISKDMATTLIEAFRNGFNMAFLCFWRTLSLLALTVATIVAVIFLLRPLILVLPGVISCLHWQILPAMLQEYRMKSNNLKYKKENTK